MKSKLTIIEFRERLKDNTKIGLPQLKVPLGIFGIFFQNSKYFYGNFDNSTFRLTRNSNFLPTFYILKGKYQNTDNKLTLNYIIEPSSKIGVIWMKIFPFVALIAGNSLFYFELKNNIPSKVYIIFNLFIVFIIFYSKWDTKRKKKNLEWKFNKIFEITV